MANYKITQLPSASVATSNNVLPIVQGGITDQITVTNLGTGILNLGLSITGSTVSATDNGNGTNFKVGDDVWIGDVNLSNTMQVRGQQTATTGFVKFGSGSSSPIVGGVAGSSLFQVTGSINASGTITAPGFTGSLLGASTTSSVALGISSSISSQNLAHNVLFQDTNAGATSVQVDGGLRYNPNTNLLTTTASYALDANLLDGKDSTAFATTASNNFIGDQNINGDVTFGSTGNSSIIPSNAGNTLTINANSGLNLNSNGGQVTIFSDDNVINLQGNTNAPTFEATSNGTGDNFKVGDDAFIGDVNLSNTIQITGQQDNAQGYIKFGSGSNNPIIGANNSSTLSITGSVSINTALRLVPVNPLPTGTTGSLAVSGSALYFHNGTAWVSIS
jgi:hypothetical protein